MQKQMRPNNQKQKKQAEPINFSTGNSIDPNQTKPNIQVRPGQAQQVLDMLKKKSPKHANFNDQLFQKTHYRTEYETDKIRIQDIESDEDLPRMQSEVEAMQRIIQELKNRPLFAQKVMSPNVEQVISPKIQKQGAELRSMATSPIQNDSQNNTQKIQKQNKRQERLFRLSPLSSRRQESDGSEHSPTVQMPLNQTITESIRVLTVDAQCQTEAVKQDQLGTQTQRNDFPAIQLSPFDTYDMYFVKDLVNNLSKDNEVLQLSNQDLKHSFMFLLEQHKKLITKLDRVQQQLELKQNVELRLASVSKERDDANQRGIVLTNRISELYKLIQVASEQQDTWLEEAEEQIYELETENSNLRMLLMLNDEQNDEVERALRPEERMLMESGYNEEKRKQQQFAKEIELIKNQLHQEYESKFEARVQELEQFFDKKTSDARALLEQSLGQYNRRSNLSDDFGAFFDGPLTAEEQDLIRQLKQREKLNTDEDIQAQPEQDSKGQNCDWEEEGGESEEEEFEDEKKKLYGEELNSSGSFEFNPDNQGPAESKPFIEFETNKGENLFDEDEREFFEELAQVFTQANQMDSSKAVGARDLDDMDDGERDEDKEEQYDYFLDQHQDENHNDAQGYHIADDDQAEEEDLEEIDEDEKQQRYREMLKEFKQKIEREENI